MKHILELKVRGWGYFSQLKMSESCFSQWEFSLHVFLVKYKEMPE